MRRLLRQGDSFSSGESVTFSASVRRESKVRRESNDERHTTYPDSRIVGSCFFKG